MKNELIIINHIGTSDKEAVVNELMVLVEEIKQATGKATVLAFSSRKAIDQLKEEHIEVDSVEAVILREWGRYSVITILPIHLIEGSDYQRLKKLVESMENQLNSEKLSSHIVLKKALLSNQDSVIKLANIIHKRVAPKEVHVLFVGHGTLDDSNMCYEDFVQSYRKLNKNSSFLTLNHSIEDVLMKLPDKIVLVPLFATSGYHVKKNLFEGEQSIYKQLIDEGKEVFLYQESLLAQKDIREIYRNSLVIQ